jgi:hypothetical protein
METLAWIATAATYDTKEANEQIVAS